MSLLKKKKEDTLGEDELLAELEKETAQLDAPKPFALNPPAGRPPLPRPPAMRPPESAMAPPAPPVQFQPRPIPMQRIEPALNEAQMAKLPLFMKVEEYDNIVKNLNVIVDSLLGMDETLETMNEIKKHEEEALRKWRMLLETTKNQVRTVLADMPETGKIQELIGKKKKAEESEKIKDEIENLKKDIEAAKKKSAAMPSKPIPPKDDKVKKDVEELKGNMKDLGTSLRDIQKELANVGKLAANVNKPQATPYKKAPVKDPWSN
ncbi:MAG: hypothetical protein ABIG20_02765 [archaeon]